VGVADDLRYAPSHKRYEHRRTALNLGDLPNNSENEVSPPTPLQKCKKRRCGHQSDRGVNRLKNRAGLQDADEVAGDRVRGVDGDGRGGDRVRGVDGDGRGEAGQEAEEGDEPSERLEGVVADEVELRRASHCCRPAAVCRRRTPSGGCPCHCVVVVSTPPRR